MVPTTMSLSHLKGMRTRYSNLLARELEKTKLLLAEPKEDPTIQSKITNSLRKLKEYLSKLEEICEKLAIVVEAAKLDEEETNVQLEEEEKTSNFFWAVCN